jgi:hypothetical protein
MICKICKRDIYADCMLTIGICVFCHYKIHSWDSNGQLVKEKDAINWICWNCGRKVPNQSFWKEKGCRWCIQTK